jgi:gamma-glutamyltranspeptidase / glutathione hydrolase
MSVRHHIGRGPSGKAVSTPRRPGRMERRPLPVSLLGLVGTLVGAALAVASCSGGGAQYAGELYTVDNFYGGVVADEPRAALVGRETLNAGGNAADAMAAAYFVMSATMPSTAGLGGGGICVVHRAKEPIASEVLDFLPRAAAGGLVAVPSSARGMAALSARYGKLPWAQLVAPAESIAQTGEAASRALAHDVALAENKLRADPQMAALFTRADGSMLGEGDNLRQPELAGVLGQIRAKGPNELYSGVLGQQLAAAAQAIGAPLTIEELRGYQARIYEPLAIKWGDQNVFLPQPPAAGGITVAQMLKALDAADDKNRAAFLADASLRLTADRAQWMQPNGDVSQPVDTLLSDDHIAQVMQGHQSGRATPVASLPVPARRVPENPFAASIVALDADGLGVACNFTMNALFGAGRVAQGTGIILAPAPSDKGFGFSALAPMIVANNNNGEMYYVSAASGGLAGALAAAELLYAVTEERVPLEKAMLRPRVYHGLDPDVVYFDVNAEENPSAELSAAGYQTKQREALGRVNAIYCPRGTPSDPDSCQLRNDYRGNGLATLVSGK